MRMFASAVILCFLIGAPALAHPYHQQDDKTKQDEKARKQAQRESQQDENARQQDRQDQQEQRARSKNDERQQQETAKQQEKQQREAAKEQEKQQKEISKQDRERSKVESRSRQEQERTNGRQEQEQQQPRNAERQRGREEQQRPGRGGHAFATAQSYHADDVHPRHGGRVIRDRDYDERFGEDHRFRVHWRHDADRFQYSGYWFTYSQPWPDDWGDDDDYYIVYDEDDDDYYLCDAEHPEFELLIIVES